MDRNVSNNQNSYPTVSSAYPPDPMMGLSPTRPGILAVMPPVDVAQAVRPFLSTTMQPTVSLASGLKLMDFVD